MDDERFIVMLLVEYVSSKMLKKKWKKRSVWVKPYLLERERKSTFQLINDFRIQDTEEFRCFLRMDTETFTVTALHLYNCFRPFLSSLLLLPPSSTTIYHVDNTMVSYFPLHFSTWWYTSMRAPRDHRRILWFSMKRRKKNMTEFIFFSSMMEC